MTILIFCWHFFSFFFLSLSRCTWGLPWCFPGAPGCTPRTRGGRAAHLHSGKKIKNPSRTWQFLIFCWHFVSFFLCRSRCTWGLPWCFPGAPKCTPLTCCGRAAHLNSGKKIKNPSRTWQFWSFVDTSFLFFSADLGAPGDCHDAFLVHPNAHHWPVVVAQRI